MVTVSPTERVAIVGMAGRFPGAGADLNAFWANVAAAADCSREVPADRWRLPPDRCSDPRVANSDTVYSLRGYYLDPFEPDLAGLNIDRRFVAELDPLFGLVLDVGGRAWADARTDKTDRSRVGVVLGNICLPTDKASDLCREDLGGRFGVGGDTKTNPLNRYVAGLPAGLLAKALALGGGSFTLDAACASSLYAIKLAADELLAGRADAMLAGGVNRSDCQYTQMGFAQLRALSPSGRCSPLDAAADGLMVGEGAGVFVLKRLSDALKQGDRVYAVIAATGLSNDMHGNLLAPAKEGQLRAMQAAYDRAGWLPADADLIECHATGTPVGDAIEFDSLRELWGAGGWAPGQCAIGSVKSTVGHLLTGAGAAAVAKVLLGMKAELLPPQANFRTPGPPLAYADGPFRVLGAAERWHRRAALEPRRAAVSGFGFGGVNAHLLLEEWTGVPVTKLQARAKAGGSGVVARLTTVRDKPADAAPAPTVAPVAVVGLAAHFGPWADLAAFQERALGGEPTEPAPKANGWGLATGPCPPGYFIESLRVPTDRFRIPPKELEETLPQQLLMLQVAAAALDDAAANGRHDPADDPATGVFVGLGLDPNTTNFHLRWAVLAADPSRADATSPPLTANRTMGALGSIAASRIARAFHFGGPSHTVCSEEGSAARALELAVRALQRKEIDRAVVGGVDLAGDPRAGGTGEGAGALVLKRLSDAERDNDRVYAVVRGVGSAGGGAADDPAPWQPAVIEAVTRACLEAAVQFPTVAYLDGVPVQVSNAGGDFAIAVADAANRVGRAGAAGAAASLVRACLAVYQQVIPADDTPSPPSRFAEVREDATPPRPLPEAGRGYDLQHPLPASGRGRGGLGSELPPGMFAPTAPRYWLHDTEGGLPRRAAVTAGGADGSCFAVILEEHARNATKSARPADRVQPLGARAEGVFAVTGTAPDDLIAGLDRLAALATDRPAEALAREWFAAAPPSPASRLAVSFVARSAAELREQVAFARRSVADNPQRALPDPQATGVNPALRDRVFFSPKPLGSRAKVAFVFPGSGNQFPGMGRDLGVQWPDLLRRQQAENSLLRGQYAPHLFWGDTLDAATPRDLMFGQVTVGSLGADLLAALGVRCDAMLGISLGESAGLFGVRAWRGRDEMLRRMRASTLFASDLAPPYDAARQHWMRPKGEAVDWVSGIVSASADDVLAVLRPGLRAYLLIVNTPTECVIGGDRADVLKLAEAVGRPLLLLSGVTLAHCEAGRPVEMPYRELHTLPVTPPAGVATYSGAYGRTYRPTDRAAADSITAGLVGTIDVPAVVNAAYRDGVRAFLEVGPGGSVSRAVGAILGDRPHLARAVHAPRQDAVSQVLRLVANLVAERLPVDLGRLYGGETRCVGHRPPAAPNPRDLVLPVGSPPPEPEPEPPAVVVNDEPLTLAELPPPAVVREEPDTPVIPVRPVYPPPPVPEPEPQPVYVAATDTAASPAPDWSPVFAPLIEATCNVQVETMRAQEVFLRLNQRITESAGRLLQFQMAMLGEAAQGLHPGLTPFTPPGFSAPEGRHDFARGVNPGPTVIPPSAVPRALDYEQCCGFAIGRIGDVLGPVFAEVDAYPTRVRLPDGPLQLVDRITLIEGEPKSMTTGRVVTEHTVRGDRWYLEAGRIPTALSVEAGQADLFLSGFLGIDFQTKGLAVYRLLDAVVSFHRGLPAVGETIVYDIHIDRFVQQGDAWLFHFWFDGTVNGEPLITMRNGVAGFFTAAALAAGKGIVQTSLDKKAMPGKKPADWRDLVPQSPCSLDAGQVEALRRGDLAAAFGPHFTPNLRAPAKLPGGMLRLVDRVTHLDAAGGRFGCGFVRAEYDIRPKEWFIECHFVDDKVMPGTLMYECCLHTLRVLLMRLGWVGEAGEVVCEPLPGVNSRLKCRGQVLDTTKLVTYEVTVRELGFRPEPFAVADALMYADGKPVVEITNMTLRMSGLSQGRLEEIWEGAESPTVATVGLEKPTLYDSSRILAFSNGNPSEAFGEPYRVFDHDRKIARLPGPPFQFLDRITAVTGEPFVLAAGAACEAEYDVPPGEWYFAANRCEKMPFSVLLEIALQPCGWLAAYCGSALTSDEDLKFRNLGGKATQFIPVTPDVGTLTTNVKLTNVSKSAGMIIQHFDMKVTSARGTVYEGTTYFGFFSHGQLANQIGMPGAKVPWPTDAEQARAESERLPHDPPFPDSMMRMVDRVDWIPAGAPKGLGLVVGRIAVDPGFWFFQAHFYQDPVWPGSLGLESFLQLAKYAAWKRWGGPKPGGWDAVAINRPHAWTYRGQVIPADKEVAVVLEITAADDDARRLTVDGFLTVDGRIIYQMTGFTVE